MNCICKFARSFQGLERMGRIFSSGWKIVSAGLVALGVQAGQLPPEAGDSNEQFAKFDAVIRAFVRSNEVCSTVAAVSRNGEIVHLRAFGWLDATLRQPLPVSARFRIASVTKPVTAAAVKSLIRDGRLQAGTRVTQVLKIPAWPEPVDARWNDITIRHLLEHKAGWNRETWGDPMFMQARIGREAGLEPREPGDVARWMMSQPLQFTPGEEERYSNFGYCTLGRVIEMVSGTNYFSFIRKSVMEPCGIESWSLARSEEKISVGEAWYDLGKEAGASFNIELMDAHGGLVSSASDLCLFMAKFWLTGDPRKPGQRAAAAFYGSLPGTTAISVQRMDGHDFAVLLNRRASRAEAPWHESLRRQLDRALDETEAR